MEKIKSEKQNQLIVPKMFRRNTNAHLPLALRGVRKNNDGKFKGAKGFQMGLKMWDDRAIFFPRNKKFKGYQKEARRYHKKVT